MASSVWDSSSTIRISATGNDFGGGSSVEPNREFMPEDQQKLVAELPRDTEVVRVFKTIAGMDPLPARR